MTKLLVGKIRPNPFKRLIGGSLSAPAGFTVTRASPGSSVSSSDNVIQVTNDVARFTYSRALLLEKSSTNVHTTSAMSSVSSSTNLTIAVSPVPAPDGGVARRLSATASGVANTGANKGGAAATDNITRTMSVYIRQGNTPQSQIVQSFTSGATPISNQASTITWSPTPTISPTGTIEYVGNGWYRASRSLTNNASGNTGYVPRVVVNDGSVGIVAGDYVDVWDMQSEDGAYATSFIPTSGGTATRQQDVATMAMSNVLSPTSLSRNLMQTTEDFTSGFWTKVFCTIIADAIAGPYGAAVIADKMVEDTNNNAHVVTHANTAIVDGKATVSIFFKPAERTDTRVVLRGAGANVFLVTTPTTLTGTLTTSGTTTNAGYEIKDVGTGWYRISLWGSTMGATGRLEVDTVVGGSTVYLGDGLSGFYLWGAQLTSTTGPASYTEVPAFTPLPGAQTSRGTLAVTGTIKGALPAAGFSTLFSIYDDTNNHITVLYNAAISTMEMVVSFRGTTVYDSQFTITSLPVVGTPFRVAMSWDTLARTLYVQMHNGTTLSALYTAVIDVFPIGTTLGVGGNAATLYTDVMEYSRIDYSTIPYPSGALAALIS